MNRRFSFSIRISLFALVCLGSFLWLGFWQLDREGEKTSMLALEVLRSQAAPIPLSDAIGRKLSGQRVQLSGRFDTEVILLLDNRVLEGSVGFEVHQLFHDISGNTALVNRGFIPMGRTRTDLPVIPMAPTGVLQLSGRIHYPIASFLGPSAVGETFSDQAFPMIVQHPDVSALGRQLGEFGSNPLAEFIVRAEELSPGALPRYWPTTVMSPERHKAYAVQWFAMAMAVLLAWLAVSFPQKNDT